VGTYLIAMGASICGNSLFASGSAFAATTDLQATSPFTQNATVYMFLKPSDRVTDAGSSNQSAGTWNATLLNADGKAVYRWSGEGRFFQVFRVPERGVYVLEVEHVGVSGGSGVTNTVTVLSGLPSDYLPQGVLLLLAGLGLTAVGLLRLRRPEKVQVEAVRDPPGEMARIGRMKELTALLSRELIGERLILFSAPILFVLMYSAGGFMPDSVPVLPGAHISGYADLFVPSLAPYNDWLNVFPVVVAMVTYTFAFQKETRVLRSLLLNPISEKALFAAKLVAVLIVVLLPIELSLLVTFSLFQPGLAVTNPAGVFGNLLPWSTTYLLYGAVMVGFAVLPAVFFRKPIYAFILPLFVVLSILTEGFGLRGYVPWTVWIENGTALLSDLTFGNGFDYSGFLNAALPSLVAALVLSIVAFLVFVRQDRE
jgi:ABC-type transport system involved in multi-copper enzyme maturation permease subunit